MVDIIKRRNGSKRRAHATYVAPYSHRTAIRNTHKNPKNPCRGTYSKSCRSISRRTIAVKRADVANTGAQKKFILLPFNNLFTCIIKYIRPAPLDSAINFDNSRYMHLFYATAFFTMIFAFTSLHIPIRCKLPVSSDIYTFFSASR